MSNMQQFKVLMNERLAAAADDIFSMVERFLTQYEEELQHRKILRSSEGTYQNETDPERPQYETCQLSGLVLHDGILNCVDEEAGSEPLHIKQEQDDVWNRQEVEDEPQKLVKDTDVIRLACKTEQQTKDDATHPAETFEAEAQYGNAAPCSSEQPTSDPERLQYAETCQQSGPVLHDGILNCVDEEAGYEPLHIKQEQDDVWNRQEVEDETQKLAKDTDVIRLACKTEQQTQDDATHPAETFEAEAQYGNAAPCSSEKPTAEGEDSGSPDLYRCQVCGMSFSYHGLLLQHAKVHAKDSLCLCAVCGSQLPSSESLLQHLQTHVKLHVCPRCGKTFRHNGNLIVHMRSHTGEKPFSCSTCGKDFSRKHSLEYHMRTHTGEKPYACRICGRLFTMASSMIRHARTHTGEKPYHCQVCFKAFTNSSDMKVHMRRMHTGEKPYSCSTCGKDFIRKNNLEYHMRTHTGEKPYSCSVCRMDFSRSSQFKSHMKRHT